MRLTLALLLIAACAGCADDPVQTAQRRYDTATAAGAPLDDRCHEARRVADAYLNRGDATEYRRWSTRATLLCDGQSPAV